MASNGAPDIIEHQAGGDCVFLKVLRQRECGPATEFCLHHAMMATVDNVEGLVCT
jgi:hypothetical protein